MLKYIAHLLLRKKEPENRLAGVIQEMEEATLLSEANEAKARQLFDEELEEVRLLAAQLSLYFEILPLDDLKGLGNISFTAKKLGPGTDCSAPNSTVTHRLFVCLLQDGTVAFLLRQWPFEDVSLEAVSRITIEKYAELVRQADPYDTYSWNRIQPHYLAETLAKVGKQLLELKKKREKSARGKRKTDVREEDPN